MSEMATPGDTLVTLARLHTPTEAVLHKNCLEQAGIPAFLSDANLVQADAWLTTAVGGVRLQVPASCEAEAREVLAQLAAGALDLAPDAEVKPAAIDPSLRLWNPDAAAFFSLFFTPVFGAWLHAVNAWRLGDAGLKRRAVWALVGAAGVTAWALFRALGDEVSVRHAFLASGMTSAYTLLWYAVAGHAQSKHLTERFGSRYVRRPIWLAVACAMGLMVLPGALHEVLAELTR